MAKNNDLEKGKALNTLDIIVVAFGAMIGWGWVVSSGLWITNGGVVGAVLGFCIGGILIYTIGLVYAELTTAMPVNGGAHVFSFHGLGKIASFICVWSVILSYISVVCFEASSFPVILQYIFPSMKWGYLYTIGGHEVYASWVIVSVVFSIVIVGMNIRGVKFAASFQTGLTLIIAFVGILLVVVAVFTGDVDNLSPQIFSGDSFAGIISNIVKVAIVTPFFFFGFDVIPQAAEEINVPLKRIGKIMILSIVLAVFFYSSIILSVGYVLSSEEIKISMASSGLVSADAMAKAFSNEVMAKVLIIGGVCGIVTSWNSFLIGGSRALQSMANSKMLPGILGYSSKTFNTPVISILIVGLFSVVSPFLGQGLLVWIVNAGNFACCVAYCIVAISFLRLRSLKPYMARPYKVKHYRTVGVSAIVLSLFMILMYVGPWFDTFLGKEEWVILVIWILIGLVFALISKKIYKEDFASMDEGVFFR